MDLHHHNKTYDRRRRVIERILRFDIERSQLSESTRRALDELLLSNQDDEMYRNALKEMFDSDVVITDKPSAEARRSLHSAIRRVGAPARRMPLYRRGYFQIAAAIAVMIVVLGVSLETLLRGDLAADKQQTEMVATVDTQVVETPQVVVEAVADVQKEVALADNSKVWVNSGSRITYSEDFGGSERRVKLEGEAYFEVERDETKPFVVETGSLDVRVLGTKFNVEENLALGTTVVTLTEGLVAIDVAGRSETISPCEKLTYYHETNKIEIETIDQEQLMADDWRTKQIFADMKTVAEILRMVGNYYNVNIDFDPASLPDNRYSMGINKDGSAESTLRALSIVSGAFDFEKHADGTITIHPTGAQ